NCMFLNELLSYQIAKYLGVPVPESAIAYMDKRILEKDPTATFVHRFYEGNLFASLELEKEDNLLENYEEMIQMKKPYISRTWNAFFSNVENINDIANVIAFDLLIANFDRYGNDGNLLVAQTTEGRKIFAIDHGHAFFGPIWHASKVNAMRLPNNTNAYCDQFINIAFGNNIKNGLINGLGVVFDAIEQKIDLTNLQQHSFLNVVDRIESISEGLVDDWFNQIPDEWFVKSDRDAQLAYYKRFILTQKDLVRFIIQRMADKMAFTNYLGGELQWKKAMNVRIV
ncbi:HipA family kinase, partial [Sporosarcina koreensis]|uniref:HipA family kinase n=1 Tax=Sporosarcina koreensis TaxID=334735 RepID=UPI00128ED2DE